MFNWNSLQEVYELSRRQSVSFALEYDESSNEWSLIINSAAPAERNAFKSASFSQVVIDAVTWLRFLGSGELKEERQT